MEKLSSVIITYNEESNIEECLKSLIVFSDEIIILDSFSSDKTLEIAKQYTDKIYQKKFINFVDQKNTAIAYSSNNWILSIDADERASKDMQDKITTLKTNGFVANAYLVNILTWYISDWFKEGGWYPYKKMRLFNKKEASWNGDGVHETPLLKNNQKPIDLNCDILHYSYKDLSDHLNRIQSYTSMSATEKFSRKKKISFLNLIINPGFKFIKTYFFQRAFIRGSRGFIFSIMASFYVFLKYAKLWEIIEVENKKIKNNS